MKQRRGFAMVMAVALLGLTAMTVAAIGITCTSQIIRTRTAGEQAQLRQLLLAGAQIAQDRLAASTALDASIDLPDSLSRDGYKLTLVSQNAGEQATVSVQATKDRHNLSETVHFSHQGGQWEMDSAQLEL